uniref:Vacuolar protein 8 n=1 Tax=Albugo laibachii Nc14 TaxID=890382 RepID=F0WEG1_9STRA|nr:vacuolar protein putative [Albugo laibachii Nc14]|eukprot:CCA19593.1 vacuolar protein putative [Albugo laibachii Nc14]
MSKLLEQLIARGRRERNPPEQREIAYNLAEISTNPQYHEKMVLKGAVQALTQLLTNTNDAEALQLTCMCLANIASCAATRARIVNDSVLPLLLNHLKSSETDITSKQYLAMTLGNLAFEPTLHEEILKEDTVKILITLVDVKNTVLGAFCAFALANVSLNEDCRFEIVQHDGIPRLIDLACSSDVKAQMQALTCLGGLCIDPQNRIQAVHEGILDALIMMVSVELSHVKLQVAEAFCCLTSTTEIQVEVADRALLTIISLALSGDPKVEERACGAIANLTEREEVHEKLLSENGLTILMTLAQAKSLDTRAEACRCLANLTTNAAILRTLARRGIVEILIEDLTVDHLICQRYAALAIANVCAEEQYQSLVMGLEAIRPLIQLARAFDRELEARRYSVLALANLAAEKENHAMLIGEDCLQALYALASTADGTCQYFVAFALGNLASNPDIHMRMVQEGGLQPIIALASSQDTDVHHHATAALRGLAIHEVNRVKIIQEGGMEPLVLLIQSGDLQVLREACGAIYNLSLSEEALFEIPNSGAIPYVIACCQSKDLEIEQRSCAIIANVAEKRENQVLICQHEAIPPLVANMRSHDIIVQREAGRAIANLTAHEANHDAIVNSKGHKLLTMYLESPDESCQRVGAMGVCNLTTNDLMRQKLMMENVVPLLIALTRAKLGGIVQFSLLAIANLALSMQTHAKMVELGVIVCVMSLTSASDDQIRFHAAFAVARIARNPSYREIITDIGGLEPILSLLEQKEDFVDREILPAICSLSFMGVNKQILSVQAIPFLVRMMSDSHSESIRLSCCSIANLAEKIDLQPPLRTANSIPILCHVLQNKDMCIQSEAARALGNLAIHSEHAILIVQQKILPNLRQMLAEKDVTCQRMSVMTLCNVSSNSDNHAEVFGVSNDTLAVLLATLEEGLSPHSTQDLEVLRYCLLTLSNLSASIFTHRYMMESLDLLVAYTKQDDVKCRQYAVFTIGNLCVNDENVDRLVEAQAVRIMISSMFPGEISLQIRAVAAIRGLCVVKQVRRQAVDQGVMEPLLLAACSDSDELKREAAAAFEMLTESKKMKAKAIKEGCLTPLLSLTTCNDPKTQVFAMTAIANIAEMTQDSTHEIMVQEGLLTVLSTSTLPFLTRQISRCFALLSMNSRQHSNLMEMNPLGCVIASKSDVIEEILDCHRFTAILIANLSRNEAFHRELIERGAVGALSAAAQFECEDNARKEVAMALRNLSSSLFALSEESITLLVTLMQDQDIETLVDTCIAVRDLATWPLASTHILAVKGLGSFLDLLKRPSSQQVKLTACQAIYNLSLSAEIQAEIVQIEGLPILLTLLQSEDADLSHTSCCILANVAEFHANQSIMVQNGVLQHLKFLVRSKNSTKDFVEAAFSVEQEAIRTIANMAVDDAVCVELVLTGALSPLKDALDSQDAITQQFATLALANLSSNEHSIPKILQDEVFPLSLSLQKCDIETHCHLLRFFVNIASSNSIPLERASEMLKSFKHSLNQSDWRLRRMGAAGIANFAAQDKYHSMLLGFNEMKPDDDALIRLLMNLVECEDSHCQLQIVSSIRGLCCDERAREAFHKFEVIPTLFKLVEGTSGDTQTQVFTSLINLSLSGFIDRHVDLMIETLHIDNLLEFLHSTRKECALFGAISLKTLATSPYKHHHETILTSVAVKELIVAQKDAQDDTFRCIATTLCDLCFIGQRYLQAVVSYGGIPIIMRLALCEDERDRSTAISTIRQLSESALHRERIASIGLQPICRALSDIDTSSEMVGNAVITLYEFSLDTNYQQQVAESVVYADIWRIAQSTSPLAKFACGILAKISELFTTHSELQSQEELRLFFKFDAFIARPNTVLEEGLCILANLAANSENHTTMLHHRHQRLLYWALENSCEVDVRLQALFGLANFSCNLSTLDHMLMDFELEPVAVARMQSLLSYLSLEHPISIQRTAVVILANFATHSGFQELLTKAGGIAELTRVLSRKADLRLRHCVTNACVKLAQFSDNLLLFDTATNSGELFIELICEAQQSEENSELETNVQLEGMKMLRSLSELEDLSQKMMNLHSSRMISALVAACLAQDSEKLQAETLLCCYHLTSNAVNQRLLADPKIIGVIIPLCVSSNMHIACFSCATVANISQGDAQVVLNDSEAIPMLVQAVHDDRITVLREAVRAIANMMQTPEFQTSFVPSNVVIVLLEACSNGDDTCQLQASLAIYRLSSNNEHQSLLLEKNAIQILYTLLSSKNERVRSHVIAILGNLSLDNGAALVESYAVPALISMLQQPLSGIDDMIVAVLRSLASVSTFSHVFHENGGHLPLWKRCCDGKEQRLLLQCAAILVKLAEEADEPVLVHNQEYENAISSLTQNAIAFGDVQMARYVAQAVGNRIVKADTHIGITIQRCLVQLISLQDDLCGSYAALAIGNIAASRENQAFILQSGGIQSLITLLEKSPSCQEYAARALSRLAVHEENQEPLFEAEAHTNLTQLLDNESIGVRLQAVMAICNLAAHDVKYAQRIVKAQTTSILIQMLEERDQMCFEAICRALCNLSAASTDQLHLLIRTEEIRSVVQVAIRQGISSRRVCLVLSNLAMNLTLATVLVDSNALLALHRLLSSASIKDQQTGALAMYNISRNSQNQAKILTMDIISTLIRLVSSLDKSVRLYATMTLCNVSSGSHSRHIDEENGIVSALIAIMREKKRDKKNRDTGLCVCDAACMTLCNLACNSFVQEEIFRQRVLEAVMRSKRFRWMILANLAVNERNHCVLWEDGVIQRALDATNSIDQDTRMYSTLLIANMSGNTNYTDILGENGGLKCLLALASSQDSNLQTLAFSSLCCLCQYSPPNRLRFIQANGISSLIMAANDPLIETHRHVAALFLVLSLEDAYANELAKLNIIFMLLQLASSSDDHIALYSCRALANISERVEHHLALTDIHKHIRRLLQHQSTHIVREMARMSANLLSTITYQNDLVADGLCDLILVGLRSDSECQYFTALALEKLTRNIASHAATFNGNGLVTLLHLAKSSDEQTQLRSVFALRNLACSEEHVVEFERCKHLEVLVQLLQHANPKTQKVGAAILHRLSFRSVLRKTLGLQGVLALVKERLVHVLDTQAGGIDWDFASECVGLMANYSEDAFHQAEIMDIEVVVTLISLTKALQEEKSVVKGSWALAEVIEQDVSKSLAVLSCNELIRGAVYKQGGLQCLLKLIESDDKTRRFASLGIRFLVSNVDVCKLIGSVLLSPFLEMATSPMLDLKQTASFVLANLTVSEENQDLLGGSIDQMIELCHCKDVRVRQYGTFALANMSSVLHLESEALCERGITSFIMLSKDQDDSVQRDVARAFVHLSRKRTLQTKLIQRGGTMLFRLLKHPNLDIKRFATLAICNLTSQLTKEEREHLTMDGGLRSLIHLARFHDVDVQRHVVLALAGLIMGAHDKRLMIENGVLGPLIDLLRSPNQHVQLCGSLALNLMVLGTEDVPKLAVMEQNALQPLGMLLNSVNAECVKSALYCLGSLGENQVVLTALDDRDLKNTISSLAQHSDTEVQRSCGYMLALWAEQDHNFEEGTINASISLAAVRDQECQDYASFILAHLCSNRQYQPLLLIGGALGPLVAMVLDKPHPKHYAGLALLKLADNYENHLKIVEEGGVEALLRLARSRSPDREIQYRASQSLGQLAKNATEALSSQSNLSHTVGKSSTRNTSSH